MSAWHGAGRTRPVLVLLVLLAAAPLLRAQEDAGAISLTDSALRDFVAHVEFLGYASEVSGKILLFRKSGVPNVGLRPWHGGVLLSALYGASEQGKGAREDFTRLVNSLNESATVSRYYLDADGDLCIEAWYPGSYVRASFGLFFKAWQDDWQRILGKHLAELKKYIN